MAGSSTNISLILPVITDATIVRDIYNLNWNTIDGRFSATYMAVQAKNAVSITGGSITGITDLAIADGGTGVSTAQLAINALTDVAGATDEYVLTKDTSTGNAIFKVAAGAGASTALDNLASVAINAALLLGTSDAFALGSTSKMWSDLFLASGAVINFNNGDITLTHSANVLTLGGGTLALGANNLTMTGSLGATGARVTKVWTAALESTADITINGTALAAIYAVLGANSDITSLTGLTTPLGAAYGGTGVANNVASTLTISGNFATTLTVTEATGVTLPASGTLATLAGTEAFTNKTLTSPNLNEAVAVTTTATKLNYITSATGTTGTTSTNIVFSTSPTLVTPALDVATATSISTPSIISASNADITIQPNGTGDTIIYAPSDVVTTKTAVATLTIAEAGTVLVSCAAVPYTITLPTASGHAGLRYHFIKTDANYFLITLDGDGAETFNYENSTSTPNTTYPRLNTYCAEVTIVSDGTNWQVVNEAMGQVPIARTYLSATQENLTENKWLRLELDTKDYDIGSNFDISTWVSGNATSTSAGHLVDSGGAFTSAMEDKRVKNTTDSTYTYVVVCNSATDLTVQDNIFTSGEGYEIKHAKFVAPIPGKYQIFMKVFWSSATAIADKKYGLYYAVNTLNKSADYRHTSLASGLNLALADIVELAIDDYVEVFVNAISVGVNICDLAGSNAYPFIIKLISKE